MNNSFSSLSSASSAGTQLSAAETPRRNAVDPTLDHQTFFRLCCSRLTSILDLSGDKLQQILDDGKENAAKNATESIRKSLGSILSWKRKNSRGEITLHYVRGRCPQQQCLSNDIQRRFIRRAATRTKRPIENSPTDRTSKRKT